MPAGATPIPKKPDYAVNWFKCSIGKMEPRGYMKREDKLPLFGLLDI